MPTPPAKRRRAAASTRRAPLVLGSHLSIAGGLHNAADAAAELRFQTVQIFVKNQRQWRAAPLADDAAAAWLAACARHMLEPTVAHATYLINLASADDELWEKSWKALADELQRCDQLGVPLLVVHPGAAKDLPPSVAVQRVAQAVDAIHSALPDGRTRLLLETTAGQGSTLGRTFAELAEMIAAVRAPERVGVCIDTCHVFAAGYDIRSDAGFAELLAEARDTVGLDRIHCWHLNDSRGGCGSRLDRHEHIGRGQIGAAGFRAVLREERFRGLPMILETPKGVDDRGRDWDRINAQRLRALATHAGAS